MIDINLIRTNKELVKENIKKKFQDQKLPLVDEVEEMDKKLRAIKKEGDELRASRNALSSKIGFLMKEKKIEEANQIKEQVKKNNERIAEIEGLGESFGHLKQREVWLVECLFEDKWIYWWIL